jgi:hypothetical protein
VCGYGAAQRVCVQFIARARVCMDTCAFALAIGRPPICAAGETWTSRTTNAPWAARYLHTTVIDAAGAIYVIGGYSGTYCKDVWVSTDGGADRTRGVLDWYLRALEGTFVVHRGYSGIL